MMESKSIKGREPKKLQSLKQMKKRKTEQLTDKFGQTSKAFKVGQIYTSESFEQSMAVAQEQVTVDLAEGLPVSKKIDSQSTVKPTVNSLHEVYMRYHESEKDESTDKLAERIKSETGQGVCINEYKGHTEFEILQGFIMQGRYLAFFTIDVDSEQKYVYLEAFLRDKNADELERKQKIPLFPAQGMDSWNFSVDTNKQFICCFLYSWNYQQHTDPSIKAYFVNFEHYIHIENPEEEEGFFCAIKTEQLVNSCRNTHIFDVESVIEMTARNENHVGITLVVTCTDDQTKFKKIYAQANFDCLNDVMIGRIKRHPTGIESGIPEKLQYSEPKLQEKTVKRQVTVITPMSPLIKKIEKGLQEGINLKKFDEFTDFQDVVGIYMLNSEPVILYENGQLQAVVRNEHFKTNSLDNQLQQVGPTGEQIKVAALSQRQQVGPPGERIKVAVLTNGVLPQFYMQSYDGTIFGYEQRDKKWQQVTSFAQSNMRLLKAHQNFVIVEHTVSFELRLLEIVENQADPVVTNLILSSSFKPQRIDSSDVDITSLLKFTVAGKDFTLSRQSSGKLLRHSEDYLDQVCGDVLISLRRDLRRGHIENKFHDHLGDPYKQKNSLNMPQLDIELETFAAYQVGKDEKHPEILLVAKPLVQSRVQQIASQILLLLLPNAFEIKQVSFAGLPIKVIVRDDKGRIFVQTENKIGEYELKEADKNDGSCVLEPKPDGVQISYDSSPFTLFDIAKIYDAYYLLLYKKTLTSNKSRKLIHSINIQGPNAPNFTEDLRIDDLAQETFELCTKVEPHKQIFQGESKQHIRACYDSTTEMVFAIVASPQFAVLYKAKFTGNYLKEVDVCDFLTVKNAERIAVINEEQVTVFSNLDMIVVNHNGQKQPNFDKESWKKPIVKSIDFKFSFTSQIKQIAFSHNVMTLIYGQGSFLCNLGKAVPEESIGKSATIHRKKTMTKHGFFDEPDEEEPLPDFTPIAIHTINELAAHYKNNLRMFKRDGYIRIKQEGGNWDQEEKFTPVDLHSCDLLTISTEKDEDEDENVGFDEVVIAQHAFLNGQSIWEVLVRNAILELEIEVSNYQIPRFLRPYIGDNCRSLVHHFSNSKLDRLLEIISMPEVKKYYQAFTQPSPIFFDIQGRTPLDLALGKRDFKSFYALVDIMLEYQDNVRNAYLVRPLLLNVLRMSLDVANLLNSSLCTYQLEENEMEHFKEFPPFHEDQSKEIVNYAHPIESLLHDDNAYEHMFGTIFPTKKNPKASKEDLQNPTRMSSKERPVVYTAVIYPVPSEQHKEKENTDKVSEILEILANCQRQSIFGTKFIQNFIDYQWTGRLQTAYFVIFVVYVVMFVISILSSALMNFDEDADQAAYDRTRVALMAVNTFLAVISIGGFEMRQIMVEKAAYFKSFWNYNDISVLIFTIVVLVLEIINYKTELADGDYNEDSASQSRMLRRSKGGGGSSAVIQTDAGELTLEFEEPLIQWLRVTYAVLIFTGFFKILNVASAFQSVGYLVAMLSGVFFHAMPFLIFFVYLNVTFTFIFYVMNISFDETKSKDPMGEYQGIEDFKLLPYIMYTFRQSLGDFKTDTFLFLSPVDRYATWFLWLCCIMINAMVFLNFLIATIEQVYEQCNDARSETAYQSKANLLRALDLVLGDYIDCKAVNILVTRESLESLDRDETEAVDALTMQFNHMKLDVDSIVHDTKEMKQEIKEIKALLEAANAKNIKE